MLDPKAKMDDGVKRLENVITGNKRKAKGVKTQICQPRWAKGWQWRLSNTPHPVKNKSLKKSKVHRPLGGSKELKDKQNWRMIVVQLAKLEREGEGHFTYQSSALHFCFLSSDYYSSDSFFSLILSIEKLFSFLPSLPRPLRPSPFALGPPPPIPHRLGGHSRETSNLLTVTDGCAEAHNGRRRHVISLAAGLRKNQSLSLTWGGLI